jgi:hypothetical protein
VKKAKNNQSGAGPHYFLSVFGINLFIHLQLEKRTSPTVFLVSLENKIYEPSSATYFIFFKNNM